MISTFNVRTLNTINQAPELIASAIEQNIDIICVQEHRFFHPELELKHNDLGEGWTLISASAWKTSKNATIGGVGIHEKISPRIVIASFNGNPQATVISCYSPTNTSLEEDVIDFYDELSALTNEIPKHNILIVGGDMNSQINAHYSYHQTTNRNGQYLLDYQTENNLLCLNTHFQKRHSKFWTYTNPNSIKAQLDFLFINKKCKNSC